MQTSFNIKKDEYLEGLRLGSKSPFIYRIPLYLFILLHVFLVLISLYTTLFKSSDLVVLLLISFSILIFASIYRPVIQKRQFNKYYESAIDIGLETEITITETGFVLDTGTLTVKRNWEQVKGWKENEDLLLLYVSDRTFHVIPKRILSEMPNSEEIIKNRLDDFSILYKKMPPGTIFSSIFLLVITFLTLFSFLR